MLLGRKGIEPLIALTIEFTAQPIIPVIFPFFYLYPLLNASEEGQAWEGNGNVMNVKVSRIVWYRIKKPIGKVVKVLDHDF